MRLILSATGLALVAASLFVTAPGAGLAAAQTPDPNPVRMNLSPGTDVNAAPVRQAYANAKTYADVPQKPLASKDDKGFGVRSPDVSDRERETRARTAFEKGVHASDRADLATSNAARLNLLDDAIVALKRARGYAYRSRSMGGEMRCAIDAKLVDALDDQAEIYYVRRALPTAMKRVNFALEVDPSDARSRQLLSMIWNAESYGGGYSSGMNR
jgi:hypothetical protein